MGRSMLVAIVSLAHERKESRSRFSPTMAVLVPGRPLAYVLGVALYAVHRLSHITTQPGSQSQCTMCWVSESMCWSKKSRRLSFFLVSFVRDSCGLEIPTRLPLLQFRKACHRPRGEIQRFQTSDWMRANSRMLGSHPPILFVR